MPTEVPTQTQRINKTLKRNSRNGVRYIKLTMSCPPSVVVSVTAAHHGDDDSTTGVSDGGGGDGGCSTVARITGVSSPSA